VTTGYPLVLATASTGVVLAASATSKLRTVAGYRAFARSLRALGLVPAALVGAVAVVITAVEAGTAIGLVAALAGVVAGAAWAVPAAVAALLVAVALLAVLSVGIALALRRRSTATCACFGAADRPLSARHVLRNAAMLSVALMGVVAAVVVPPAAVDLAGVALCGPVGAVIAVVLIRLDELVELFAPTGAGRPRVRG
jgi:hypothetical protein